MTRSGLMARILEIYPYMSVKNIDRLISIVVGEITDALKDGRRVELRGFGAFSVRNRESVIGRNPKTGEKVQVKARKVPFFRAGRHMKDMINGNAKLTED